MVRDTGHYVDNGDNEAEAARRHPDAELAEGGRAFRDNPFIPGAGTTPLPKRPAGAPKHPASRAGHKDVPGGLGTDGSVG